MFNFKTVLLRTLWTLSMVTWSLISNIINTIVLVGFLIPYGKYITKKYWCKGRLILEINKNGDNFFGGLECGWVILLGDRNSLSHEIGHTIQCSVWGPFYWLVIGIPSSIRYQYQNYLWKHNMDKYIELKPYSSIWFEKQATNWGNKLFKT